MHTQVTVNDLKQKVDLVLGRQNCELQLKNVRLINVFTGQIISGADIFIHNGKIVDAGLKCQAKANEFFEKLDINIRTKTRERELRHHGHEQSRRSTPFEAFEGCWPCDFSSSWERGLLPSRRYGACQSHASDD